MQTQTLNISDFGDGLNTKLPASRLKPSEAVLVSNLRTIGGTLYPRKDKVNDGIVVAGSPVHSQAIFEKSSGERYHMAGVGNDVYIKTLIDSPWWDTAWQYRIADGITVTNSSSISEVGYVIWVTLASNFDYSKAKANGDDIRFVRLGTTEVLPYWIEKWGVIGKKSYIAVKVDVPAQSSFTIDMYVGNASATPMSNRTGMFLIDDTYDTNPFVPPIRLNNTGYNGVSIEWDETTKTVVNGYKNPSDYNAWGYSLYNFTMRSGAMSVRIKRNSDFYGGVGIRGKDGEYNFTATIGHYVSDFLNTCTTLTSTETRNSFSAVVALWYRLDIKFDKDTLTACVFNDDIVGLNKGDIPLVMATIAIDSNRLWKIGLYSWWVPFGHGFEKDFVCYPYNSLITVTNLSILEGQTTPSLWQKAFLSDGITSIFTSSADWRTVSIRNSSFIEKIVFANGVDNPRTWDGTNWVVWDENRGLNKPVKYLAVHKGRLFAANAGGGEKSRLYYCNTTPQGLADFDSVNTATNRSWQSKESTVGGEAVWIDNQEDFLGGGLEITGLIPAMYDSLIVAKPDEITLLYGNSPSDWGKKKLPYPYGIYAPMATIKFEDTLFFISKFGVHYMAGESGNASAFTFDNIKADSLTEMIQTDFLAQNLPSAVGVVWDNKYYIFFPNTSLLKCFVLDWRRKSWWIDSGENMVSAIVDNYKNIMYTGNTDGKIYKYENASAVVGTNIWKSGLLQPMPNCEVRIREIIVSCKGYVKLTISSEKETPPPIDITVTGGLKHVRVGHNIQGNQFELQLENLTDSVEGVEMMVIPLRRV